MEYKDYTKRVVAFIDILGFQKQCENLEDEKDFNEIKNIMEEFKKTKEEILNYFDRDRLLKDVEVTFVSDSLIISIPLEKNNNLILFLNIILKFQIIMLIKGYLLRGLIYYGKTYHKNDIIFGNGYIKAYQGEKTIGFQPRIVMDETIMVVIEALKNNIDITKTEKSEIFYSTETIISKDNDNKYYIDYLDVGIEKIKEEKTFNYAEYEKQIIDRMKEKIAKYCYDEKIIAKYGWILGKIKMHKIEGRDEECIE